jgi:CHAD domain-containing protein
MAQQEPNKIEVELAHGVRWTFKRNRTYLIAFDKSTISSEDVLALQEALGHYRVKDVIAVLLEDVPENALKVFELPKQDNQ